jgi:hypothetical protein
MELSRICAYDVVLVVSVDASQPLVYVSDGLRVWDTQMLRAQHLHPFHVRRRKATRRTVVEELKRGSDQRAASPRNGVEHSNELWYLETQRLSLADNFPITLHSLQARSFVGGRAVQADARLERVGSVLVALRTAAHTRQAQKHIHDEARHSGILRIAVEGKARLAQGFHVHECLSHHPDQIFLPTAPSQAALLHQPSAWRFAMHCPTTVQLP